jgi:hypothetical protein
MSIERDKDKITHIHSSVPNVEIMPHPDEVLELDEETIAIGKAKLAGVEFEDLYGEEDQVSSSLLISQQKKKIRDLFQTPEDLRFAFSSDQRKEQARKDMIIDGIDLDFIKDYCRKEQLSHADDATALLLIGFGESGMRDADV